MNAICLILIFRGDENVWSESASNILLGVADSLDKRVFGGDL